MTVRALDPALDGFCSVTFSEGNLSPTDGGRRFERLVEIVNAQRSDVVAVVGDLVDGEVDELRDRAGPAGHRRPQPVRDTQLYVTCGAGYWGPPMRVGARPEVTVAELRFPSD